MTQSSGYRRRKYLVDRKLQIGVALLLLGTVVGVELLYHALIFVLTDETSLMSRTGIEARDLLMKLNAIYFALSTLILFVVALLLMHRVAGPVGVVRGALQRMLRGEPGGRVSLRRFDYLKDLAGDVRELSAELDLRRGERIQDLRSLNRCLEEKDLDAAAEIATRLLERDGGSGTSAVETPAAPAASPQA